MNIREQARDIEVMRQADVIVAGGGVAGCSAALASARQGATTVLLERNGVLGGVATAGLMANIGNKFLDGDGRLVIRGIPLEFVERMVALGAASDRWQNREVPGVVIDSEQLKIVLAEALQEAGVDILTHALAARPIVEGGLVRGVFVETKMGRSAVLAPVVVDATGEADLAWQAGCPMSWSEGSASVEFKMGDVDLDELCDHFARHPETFPRGRDMVSDFAVFERNWKERGILFFPHGGGFAWDIFQDAIAAGDYDANDGVLYGLDAAGLYGLRGANTVIVNSNFWRVDTLDPASVARAELAAQRACYSVADFFQRRVPGFGQAHIVQIASDIGIRVSRGIDGRDTLSRAQTTADEPSFSTSVIGCLPTLADWGSTGSFFHGHTFDVPYGIMLPKGIEGLLVASGKSVSCDPLGLVRGMAGCMLVGQAAGVAAALSASSGCLPDALSHNVMQRALVEQDVWLGDRNRLDELGIAE